MTAYKLAIFDWDGTLLDSIGMIVNSVHSAAQDLDLPILEDQAVKNIIGLRLDTGISQLYPELSSKQLAVFLENYTKHFLVLEQTVPNLYPDVLKILQKLKKAGLLIAIATGKSRRGLDRILASLGLAHFFDATRCADETAGKPDPTMLYELLAQFSLSNSEAIMIGDASFDLQMANNAGMDSIAVSYGAQESDVLMSYSPRLIINQFNELPMHLIAS